MIPLSRSDLNIKCDPRFKEGVTSFSWLISCWVNTFLLSLGLGSCSTTDSKKSWGVPMKIRLNHFCTATLAILVLSVSYNKFAHHTLQMQIWWNVFHELSALLPFQLNHPKINVDYVKNDKGFKPNLEYYLRRLNYLSLLQCVNLRRILKTFYGKKSYCDSCAW